ncbi:MAG TPA: hypothetical protein DCQ25_01630 [Elusimicrobia bacterium]|nr:hypothetical protein [Elusimicrobiota bacterium]
MEQKAVLVIEDSPAWQELHKRVMRAAGFSVHVSGTCTDGVRLAGLLRPDCIILDFHLPDGDAGSVCAELRQCETTKDIPVILFSSDPDAEIEAAASCGGASFMLKGWEQLSQLPTTIDRLLGSKKRDCPQL